MHNGPVNVLLVEDDEDDYVITRDLLSEIEDEQFDLEWVSTYDAALEAIQHRQHDVIFIDYRLGARTGLDLLREMVGNYFYVAPIILLTGQGDHEVDVEAMQAGAADYLIKDQLQPPLLERSIRYAIEHTRMLNAERKQAQELLHQQAAAMKASMDGIALLNQSGEYIYLNDAYVRMHGYDSPEDLIGQSWEVLYDAGEIVRFKQVIIPTLWRDGQWQGEAVGRKRDSSTYPQEMSLTKIEAGGLVCVVRDVTERKRAEAQLVYDALHDALTGLPNRALLMDHLNQAIARSQRQEDYGFAVLFLDLDRFKVINDSLGHTVGDQLLIAFACRLKACLRVIDTFVRLGGDEFALLLEDVHDLSDATRVAERIQAELTAPFNLNGHEVFTTVSIGIALSKTGYDDAGTLLRNADIAMYRAKTDGRADYQVFNTAMHTDAVKLLQLENDLRWALERQELQLYYQPIVTIETGRFTGFEALLRWQHPQRGLVLPAEFLSVAEETGLIVPIGDWLLREACSQLRTWQRQFPVNPPLTMSVNLSSRGFSQPNLVRQVEQILSETHLDAHHLQLEVTEGVIMENLESSIKLLQLRNMGVQLCIDDFGTGYSSLGRLRCLPIDILKIDRSFISQVEEGKNLEIVRTIMALAHHLGMKVTAEGVETKQQLALLQTLNCEYGQGYFFSQPVDSKVAGALLAALVVSQPVKMI